MEILDLEVRYSRWAIKFCLGHRILRCSPDLLDTSACMHLSLKLYYSGIIFQRHLPVNIFLAVWLELSSEKFSVGWIVFGSRLGVNDLKTCLFATE